MHPQLTLPFAPQDAMTFDSFYSGPNAVLYEKLRHISESNPDDRQVLLWGPADSGKTHLLTACCQTASENGYRIAYLPGSLLTAEAVSGLSDLDLVCVDDLQELPASRDSEMALFQLVNAVRAAGGILLFASRCAIAGLQLELADLKTRLAWGAVFAVQPLSADNVRQALKGLSVELGIQLGDDVLDYLLNHFPRDIGTQTRQLRELGKASLKAQRRVTIPLVREVCRTEVSVD